MIPRHNNSTKAWWCIKFTFFLHSIDTKFTASLICYCSSSSPYKVYYNYAWLCEWSKMKWILWSDRLTEPAQDTPFVHTRKAFLLPRVPEVFLACSKNFWCWPTHLWPELREKTSGTDRCFLLLPMTFVIR